MIAYIESSALICLALNEPGATKLTAQLANIDKRYCHQIGYIEMRSGMSRTLLRRPGQDADALRDAVDSIWAETNVIKIDDAQIARAAGLCERYQLRAYDALHLAAAEALMRIVSSKHMRWFGFDEMQNKAAVAIGLRDGMVD